MTTRLLKFLGLSAFSGVLLLTPAYAMSVSYSTAGVFSGCSGAFVCSGGTTLTDNTGNGLSLVYSQVNPGTVMVPPVSNAQFGTFKTSGMTGGSDTGSFTFTLTITQTNPGPTLTESFVTSDSSVSITPSSSGLTADFAGGTGTQTTATPVFDLNGVEYSVNPNTSIVDQTSGFLVPFNTKGVSTITGTIDTPEPMLYTTTFVGLIGLFTLAIRRKRTGTTVE